MYVYRHKPARGAVMRIDPTRASGLRGCTARLRQYILLLLKQKTKKSLAEINTQLSITIRIKLIIKKTLPHYTRTETDTCHIGPHTDYGFNFLESRRSIDNKII